MAERWLRWYVGTSEDAKFRTVARAADARLREREKPHGILTATSREVVREVVSLTVSHVAHLWQTLLEDAANPAHEGVAVRGVEFYANVVDLEEEAVTETLSRMVDHHMLRSCEDSGHYVIVNWNKRQFKTDRADPTARERQRKKYWRDKDEGQKTSRQPHGNEAAATAEKPHANLTETSRSRAEKTSRLPHATSRPDTDSESEEETPIQSSSSTESNFQESSIGERGGLGERANTTRQPAKRPAPTSIGTRISPDWEPSLRDIEYAKNLGISPQVVAEHVAPNFRDHWLQKAGAAARSPDWAARWRTWCRNEIAYHPERYNQPAVNGHAVNGNGSAGPSERAQWLYGDPKPWSDADRQRLTKLYGPREAAHG